MSPMKPMEPITSMDPMQPMEPIPPMQEATKWWPGNLGAPSSSGGQNGLRYAFFPQERRLAVQQQGGEVVQYDTGDHAISGVSQQSGQTGLRFSSQQGDVDLATLKQVG